MTKPTERQRVMRKIARRNMRNRGLESTLLGLQVIGGVDAVARARGEPPPAFGADDYIQLMRGVGDELWKDPTYRAMLAHEKLAKEKAK